MTTFYLKYRPQRVSELDLDSVREQLAKIIASENKPHAFLFAGPRGAGKTSTARILAKAVNCEAPEKNGEPCNKCSQCVSISRGTCLDVIEIDAASHRGVDDVRSLRETIKLAPAGSKIKVYIIDEAHMLTTEAANALLKTLEEPPSHAMFILATTTQDKLLDTIRSRCTVINFYKGSALEVARALKRAIDGEGLKLEDGVLEFLAKSVDGSLREAHKILEQLALNKGEIKLADVKKLLSSGGASAEKLIGFLAKKDMKGAMEEIEARAKEGINLKSYTVELVGSLRRMLLGKMGIETPLRQEASEGQVEFEVKDLKRLIEIFSEAALKIPTALIPQLPLELGVVEYCYEQSQSAHLVLNSPGAESAFGLARSRSRGLAKGELSTLDFTSQDLAQTREHGVRVQTPALQVMGKEKNTDSHSQIHEPSNLQPPTSNLDEAELEEKWREIVRVSKTKNFAMEALLRAARPHAFDGKTLQIEIFYRFHKDKLESEPLRTIIAEVASQVLGTSSIIISCILSSTKKRAADVENIALPPESEDLAKLAEDIFSAGADGKVH